MIRSRLAPAALLISGPLAIGIGALLLAAPQILHASHGVILGSDPNLLSEIRAPGAALMGTGGLMLLGLWRPEHRAPALLLGATVYGAYGLARLISGLVDGVPETGLIAAAGIEAAVASLCLVALRPREGQRTVRTADA